MGDQRFLTPDEAITMEHLRDLRQKIERRQTEIAEYRQRRDVLVKRLRDADVPERWIAAAAGVSGPRIHQIATAPAASSEGAGHDG